MTWFDEQWEGKKDKRDVEKRGEFAMMCGEEGTRSGPKVRSKVERSSPPACEVSSAVRCFPCALRRTINSN